MSLVTLQFALFFVPRPVVLVAIPPSEGVTLVPFSEAGATFLSLVGNDTIAQDTATAGGDLAVAVATLGVDPVTGQLVFEPLTLTTGASSDDTVMWAARHVGASSSAFSLSDTFGASTTLDVAGPAVVAVTVTIVSAEGGKRSFTLLVWVDAPPVAAIEGMPLITLHAALDDASFVAHLDGSSSHDPEGSAVTGAWAIVEGSLATRGTQTLSIAEPEVGSPIEDSLHGILSGVPGGFVVDVALTATSSDSAAAEGTAVATLVVNALPVVPVEAPAIVFLRDPVNSFSATVAASTDIDGVVESVEWVVEDGVGGVIQVLGADTDTVSVSNIQLPGHVNIEATVVDNDGGAVSTGMVSVDVRLCDSTDTDGDGVADCYDECLDSAFKVSAGVCGCSVEDTDGDGDGVPDCIDACPEDALKVAPGLCGCGETEQDSDGDGTLDCHDACPADGNKVEPGLCGCGTTDVDTDGDGSLDCHDACPADGNKVEPGLCGCGTTDVDSDGDSTPDCHDECPADADKTQLLQCGCGQPEHDFDGDGVANCVDACVTDADKSASAGLCGCDVADTDSDGDGVADCVDVCPADGGKVLPGMCGCGVPDVDSDGDGVLDCMDECLDGLTSKKHKKKCGCGHDSTKDKDGDGVADCVDACPDSAFKVSAGVCGCSVEDTDGDGDGVPDCIDACPEDALKVAPGLCGCGETEQDSDGDGTLDCHDACPTDPIPDLDGDGLCSHDQCPESEAFGPVNGHGCTLGDMCPCHTRVEDRHAFRECVREAISRNGFHASWNSERKQRDVCAVVLEGA